MLCAVVKCEKKRGVITSLVWRERCAAALEGAALLAFAGGQRPTRASADRIIFASQVPPQAHPFKVFPDNRLYPVLLHNVGECHTLLSHENRRSAE